VGEVINVLRTDEAFMKSVRSVATRRVQESELAHVSCCVVVFFAQLNDPDCLCLLGAYALLGKEEAILALFDVISDKPEANRIMVSPDRLRVLEAAANGSVERRLAAKCTTDLTRIRLVDLPKFRKSAKFADGK
jgi:hypothetical protein